MIWALLSNKERLSVIFENTATEAKIQLFYLLKKTLLVNRFQK